MPKKKGKAQKERERKKRQKKRRVTIGMKGADKESPLEIGQEVTMIAWFPKTNRPGIIVDIDEYPDESGLEATRYHVKWPKRDGSSTIRAYRRESLQPTERI